MTSRVAPGSVSSIKEVFGAGGGSSPITSQRSSSLSILCNVECHNLKFEGPDNITSLETMVSIVPMVILTTSSSECINLIYCKESK